MMDARLLKCFSDVHSLRGRQRFSVLFSTEMRMVARDVLWKCNVVGRMRKRARTFNNTLDSVSKYEEEKISSFADDANNNNYSP